MSIFDIIPDFLARQKFAPLDDAQNRAVVEALALAMVVDGHTDERERAHLAKMASHLTWQSQEVSADEEAKRMLTRAREAVASPGGIGELVDEIAEGLGEEEWLKEEVYLAAGKIVGADEKIHDDETAFLKAMVNAFDLPSDSLRVLTKRLMDEGHV